MKRLKPSVSEAKMRWLSRCMYSDRLSSTAKVFAFVVADMLNCVTLDCWPTQETIADRLGQKAIKTAKRAARELERKGFIRITRGKGRSFNRYAPVFNRVELDIIDPPDGQLSTKAADRNDPQSLSLIQCLTPSSATADRPNGHIAFTPRERGSLEIHLANLLGPKGLDILSRLAILDDAHVTRLCRALVQSRLCPDELQAARVAANYVKRTTTRLGGPKTLVNEEPRPAGSLRMQNREIK
jgi:hypothetical protein